MSIVVTSNTPEVTPAVEPKAEVVETKAAPIEGESPKESEALEGAEAEKPEKVEPEEDKEVKGVKKRIDKLVKQRSDAQRERDLAARERDHYREQLLKVQKPATEEKPQVTKTDEPQPEQFGSHAEYVKALSAHTIKEERAKWESEQRESAVKNQYQKQVETFTSSVKEFSKTHDDFQEVMESVDDIPMSMAVQDIFLNSENGVELSYELAKNREEYKRICELSPLAAARELGRFEASLVVKAPKEVKTTKAPAPIKPVGSGGGPAKKTLADASKMDQKEFEAWVREQEKQKAASW